MLGSKVGNYSITEKIATGGMGEVYVARHDLMERDAVVKVLRPEMSVNTEMVQRFFNEARAATSIQHPGIVDVYDMGYADDGRAFLVMEKLRGESLAARLAKARLSTSRSISYIRQLAGALGAAHERGIVHRDLKPDNLFVVPDPDVVGGERIKVLDFGIAKLAVEKGGSLVTSAGAVFGTPAYMAPEQCTSTATVDLRADLYAVGCIFYELLCGSPPFGHGGIELFAAHLRDDPPSPRSVDASIPGELDVIVLRLLAKTPEVRFQSCGQLVDALDACPSYGEAVSSPPDAGVAAGADGALADAVRAPLPTPSQLGNAATMPSTDKRLVPATARAEEVQATEPAGTVDTRPLEPQPAQPVASQPAQVVGSQPPQTVGSQPPQTAGAPQVAAAQPVTTQSAASGQSQSMTVPGRRSGLWAVVGIIAVLAVGGGVFALTRTGGDEEAAEPDRTEERRRDRRERDPSRNREARVDRLLGEGMQALVAEDWATAVGKATQVLSTDSENAAALDLQARAEGEIENRATFRKLEEAFEAKQVEDVARLYDEIPALSAYRDKAKPLYEQTRDEWFAPQLEKAEALAKKRRCKEVRALRDEVAALFPDVSPAIEQVANGCRPRSTAKPVKDPPKPEDPPKPKPTAQNLLAEARAAAKAGDVGESYRLCKESLALQPGNQTALFVCACAACNLKNAGEAERFMKQLKKAGRKRMAEQLCRRNGVRIGRPGPKPVDVGETFELE